MGIRPESTARASLLKVQKQPYSELLAQWALLGACTLVFILFAPVYESKAAEPDPPVHECDRLAASPHDNDRVAEGVWFPRIEIEHALRVCNEAITSFPNVPRFQFQYGRVLYRAHKFDEAAPAFARAAELGYVAGFFSLGVIYRDGTAVNQDLAAALEWFLKAAKLGHRRAQVALGYAYQTGSGVSKDFAEAVKWYRGAAELGDGSAQIELGEMYELGQGVPQNYEDAATLYRKAAEQGYYQAQYNLGRLFDDGKGVQQDDRLAAKWYRKAFESLLDVNAHMGVPY